MTESKPLRYVDVSRFQFEILENFRYSSPLIAKYQIGINLSDPVFRGKYRGKQAHEDDLDDVIQRARDVGCSKFMVTGSDLVESKHAVQVATKYRECQTS